ncbi:MAG: hypothetical protein IPG06_25250 [Haliea sp.]|nr:hypothetical protein [Haliea sp.]
MTAVAHVVEIVFRRKDFAHVIRHHDAAWTHQSTLLDQLQVGCVQVLPVIEKHKVKAALQGADHFAGRPMHKRDLV